APRLCAWSVWARTRRCSSAFSSPCINFTSASCAGTFRHLPPLRAGTCYLTRRVRGWKRSCGSIRTTPYLTATPRCTASSTRTSTFLCQRALSTPQRTRAHPRTHLRVRIGRPRARARLPRLSSRLRATLIPLRHRARLPPEQAQGQAQKRMRSVCGGCGRRGRRQQHATRAGGGSRLSLVPRTPHLRSPR
ncbi:hypothetical protein B0H14DRAFT_2705344, partial [Mycena olivaceomarginata]